MWPSFFVVVGVALIITVQSFDAHMDFGLMADAAALPDVKAMALALDAAWEELRVLPVPGLKALPTASASPSPRKAKLALQAPAARKVSRARRNSGVKADGSAVRSR